MLRGELVDDAGLDLVEQARELGLGLDLAAGEAERDLDHRPGAAHALEQGVELRERLVLGRLPLVEEDPVERVERGRDRVLVGARLAPVCR